MTRSHRLEMASTESRPDSRRKLEKNINLHKYIYEIYNALHSRGWLESEARAVARWRGLGRNGREVECF